MFIKNERERKVNKAKAYKSQNPRKAEAGRLGAVVTQLKNILGDAVVLASTQKRKSTRADALLRLADKEVFLELRHEVHTPGVKDLQEIQQKDGELLVAAEYISPMAKSRLSSHGIHYLDSKGNASIKIGGIYIHVEGIPNSPAAKSVRLRLFSRAGLQMLFVVLVDPQALNMPYRYLAERANVSLGSLNILYRALKEDGYIVRGQGKKWVLVERERLLERWVHEYVRRLKPALTIGAFQPSQSDFRHQWKALALKDDALWGGEPGADLLTNFLQPAQFTLYAPGTRTDIIKAYRWKPSEQGSVIVYQKFWSGDLSFDQLAQPLLVYADLLDQGDGRSIEVARMIYDRYLHHD